LAFRVRVGGHEGTSVIDEAKTVVEINSGRFVFSNEETLHNIQKTLNEVLLS
jgi:hypothetical protein